MANFQGLRVFVVDDEETIAFTLAKVLELNGFSTRFFTRPLDALAAAQTDIPDLLISDVAMPELSGIDLAVRMKESHQCKILLFSGQAHTLDLLDDVRQRGYYFRLLQKPIFPEQLLSEIEKIRAV